MQTKTITADEHETISQELTDRTESHDIEGDFFPGGFFVNASISTIIGNHEDLGRTTLRRENGSYTVEAEELSFVTGTE